MIKTSPNVEPPFERIHAMRSVSGSILEDAMTKFRDLAIGDTFGTVLNSISTGRRGER